MNLDQYDWGQAVYLVILIAAILVFRKAPFDWDSLRGKRKDKNGENDR